MNVPTPYGVVFPAPDGVHKLQRGRTTPVGNYLLPPAPYRRLVTANATVVGRAELGGVQVELKIGADSGTVARIPLPLDGDASVSIHTFGYVSANTSPNITVALVAEPTGREERTYQLGSFERVAGRLLVTAFPAELA